MQRKEHTIYVSLLKRSFPYSAADMVRITWFGLSRAARLLRGSRQFGFESGQHECRGQSGLDIFARHGSKRSCGGDVSEPVLGVCQKHASHESVEPVAGLRTDELNQECLALLVAAKFNEHGASTAA